MLLQWQKRTKKVSKDAGGLRLSHVLMKMRLCKVQAMLPCATADGVWHPKGSVFVLSLAEELRLRQLVHRLEIFEDPGPPMPEPPKSGTAAVDEPPQHRMMLRKDTRRAE